MTKRNHFRIIHAPTSGGRVGQLEAHASPEREMLLETPAVVPVVDLVGGPPGPDRNGGLWRGIKWWLFLNHQVPSFQCNIVHLLSVDQGSSDWSGWRAKPFGEWITDWQEQTDYQVIESKRPENGYPFHTIMNWWEFWRQPPGRASKRPLLFGESGGHALTRESLRVKCEEDFGVAAAQSSMLDMQLEMGADVVMSLDYPHRGRLTADEVRRQRSASIANGLELLAELAGREAAAMPYIAVHAVDGQDAEAYIGEFMAGWRALSPKARAIQFGIAVGSLSSRASQPEKLVDVLRGVRAGLRRAAPEIGGMPPVHVLGISGRIMAVLVYLGADSFSSQSYAEAAKRGQYLDAHFQPTDVTELDESQLVECGCPICSVLLERKFLPVMKLKLAPKAKDDPAGESQRTGIDKYYCQTDTGEKYSKSDLYAVLAVHNWLQVTREAERVRAAVKLGSLPQYIWALAGDGKANLRFRRAVEHLAEADAQAGEPTLQEAFGQESPVAVGLSVASAPRFTLPTGYMPPAERDVLVLVDTDQADAVVSEVRVALAGAPIIDRIHVVRLVPGQGCVPEEFELTESIKSEPVPEDAITEYAARFRSHYRHSVAVGTGSTFGGMEVVPHNRLVRWLRAVPARNSSRQLSLWDM